MPRIRQLKVEDASSSGHGIGKAHIEIQSWRDDVLAPACAKRGRCIGDFLLVAGEVSVALRFSPDAELTS